MGRSFFLVSHGAAAWLQRYFEMVEKRPDIHDMVPTLIPSTLHMVQDTDGRVVERYSGDYLFIGWYPVDVAASLECEEITIQGRRILVPVQTLEILGGKELVTKEVEIGVPTPGDKKMEVLAIGP
jgi:hypothetical protein